MRFRLVVGIESNGVQKNLSLFGSRITVGRNQGHIALEDRLCSRTHAEILISGSKLFLRDRQSSNGTLVNGEAVQVWEIDCGDVIEIGSSRVTIVNWEVAKSGQAEETYTASWEQTLRSLSIRGYERTATGLKFSSNSI